MRSLSQEMFKHKDITMVFKDRITKMEQHRQASLRLRLRKVLLAM